MEQVYHIPAMLKETIEGLRIKGDGIYVDVTFGGGGHSRAIMENLEKGGKLYSFDQDVDALRNVQRDNTQREDVKREDAQQEDIQRDDTQREDVKRDDAQREDTHQEDIQRDDTQREDTQREDVKRDDVQRDDAQREDTQRENVQSTKKGKLTEDERWTFVHSNFRYLRNWMDYYGVQEIDGVLADLGVSFHHFDCPERGFSFRFSAPLDMRMNQTAKRTAADIVNGYSEEELARLLWLYGELKNSRAIAKNICKARAQKPIERTEELVAAAGAYPHLIPERMGEIEVAPQYKKDLARLFQALRIEVNDEMGALREMLVAARDLLKPGGRIAILTYHSLEDRMVKNFLRSGNLEGTIEKDFYGNILTPFTLIEKGREACAEEIERNPRSRSAKLRVAEKRPS